MAVDQNSVLSPLSQDLFDPIFFPKALHLFDELDGNPILGCDRFGIGPDLIAQRFCPAGIIKDADALDLQIRRHPSRVAESGQGSLNDHTVVTGKNTRNFVFITRHQRGHRSLHAIYREEDNGSAVVNARANSIFMRNTFSSYETTCMVPAMPG